MSRVSLAIVAALLATPALAQTAPVDTADAPTKTARISTAAQIDTFLKSDAQARSAKAAETPAASTSGPVSTAAQIDAFLKSAPAPDIADARPLGTTGQDRDRPDSDGKVHGVVEASVGTGGYRNLYMQSDIPLGDKGTLSIAVQQGKGRGYWGDGLGYGGYGGGYSGFGYGGPGLGYGGFGYGGPGRWSSGRTTTNSVGIGIMLGDSSDSRRCDRDSTDDGSIDVRRSCRERSR